MEYEEEITYEFGYKIIHKTPILSKEEREKKNKEILLGLYKVFTTSQEDLT